MKKIGIVLLFCFFSVYSTVAATVDDVERFYNQLLQYMIDEEFLGKAFFDYTVEYVERNGEKGIPPANTKIYRDGYKLYINSQSVELWKSKEKFALIVHSNRTVHYGKNSTGTASDKFAKGIEQMLEFQKYLFKEPKNVTERKYSESEIKVILVPSQIITDVYKVKDVSFVYDTDRKVVTQMMMTYTNQHRLINQKIFYRVIDLKANHTILEGNPVEKIVSSAGKLNKKYSSYTLIQPNKK